MGAQSREAKPLQGQGAGPAGPSQRSPALSVPAPPSATPPAPHGRWKQGARHALLRKRPGTEKEAGWVLSFLGRFPAASAAAIRRAVRIARWPPCCSAAGASHQPRFHVGARRFGWEGVGARGLRCQRPPPLEVGRERIHLCCLLFVRTCLAICLSLSCSPATGRLRVLGSRRLQLYARCHLECAWL